MTPGFKLFITAIVALVAAIILIGLAGCEYIPAPAPVPRPAKVEMERVQIESFGPDANGVMCYHYPYSSANLSCVKVR